MTKKQARLDRLLNKTTSITYDEIKAILVSLNYKEYDKGKTSGSRKKFYRESDGAIIMLHKPHPGNELKDYQKRDIISKLEMYGDIKNEK